MSTSNKKPGRPRAYTPEALEAKFEEYVRWVEGNPIFIQKVSAGEIIKVETDRPLTIVDFCQFAGISKDTFRRYEDEFCGPLTRIREAIEADQRECSQWKTGEVHGGGTQDIGQSLKGYRS